MQDEAPRSFAPAVVMVTMIVVTLVTVNVAVVLLVTSQTSVRQDAASVALATSPPVALGLLEGQHATRTPVEQVRAEVPPRSPAPPTSTPAALDPTAGRAPTRATPQLRRTVVAGESASMPSAALVGSVPVTVSPTAVAVVTPTAPPPAPSVPLPPSTSSPAVAAMQSPQPEARTFVRETFDAPGGGWRVDDQGTWSVGYADGQYHLRLNGAPSAAVAHTLRAASYRLSADLTVLEGSAGLVVLSNAAHTFYSIVVSPTGGYCIRSTGTGTEAKTETVQAPADTPLQQGVGTTNRVSLEQQGDMLRCLINDHVLAEFPGARSLQVDQYSMVLTSQTNRGHAVFDNVLGVQLAGPSPGGADGLRARGISP